MKFLCVIPSWDVIKGIGGSRVVSLAGLFPFVGYILIANEGIIDWFTLIVDVNTEKDSGREFAISRMREIYFALVWLSSGVILLKLFCPREISLFNSGYDYHRSEAMIAEPLRLSEFQRSFNVSRWSRRFWPRSLIDAVEKAAEVKLDDIQIRSAYLPDLEDAVKSRDDWFSSSGREISLCLNTAYHKANYDWPLIRAAAALAFLVGYLKLSYPAYKVLLELLPSSI